MDRRRGLCCLSADGVGMMAIRRQTGKGKPTIWRWQARFWRGGRWAAARRDTTRRQEAADGVFRSIADLQAAINAYLAEHNVSPKLYVWTKPAETILAKLDRCPVPS